jgi:hypothetical protein
MYINRLTVRILALEGVTERISWNTKNAKQISQQEVIGNSNSWQNNSDTNENID